MGLKVKKVLISQPAPATEKSPYFDIAKKYHLQFDFIPLIRVEKIDIKEFRQQRINILDYTVIVFTSKVAIDHFFSICESLRIVMPETMKYFCISEAVALYLQKYIVYRKRKIFFSQTGKMDGLSSVVAKNVKEKYFVPVSNVHSEGLTSVLESKNVDYIKGIMYKTVSNHIPEEELSTYDMFIFFSPSGINSLLTNSPHFDQGERAIACFGRLTAKAVLDAGLRLDCHAPTPELPSMAAALDAFIRSNQNI